MNFDYDKIDPEDQKYLDLFLTVALSTKQGVQHTFLIAEEALRRGVDGCFVECGVCGGAGAATLAYALKKHKQGHRTLHLFDSFEGIPLAGPRDHDQPGIGKFIADVNLPIEERLKSSGISSVSVEAVRGNLANWGLDVVHTEYHKGWFQHTLPNTSVRNIGLLRLDGDLHESTKCCMDYLYEKVVPGGFVILDDYPLAGSRAAFEEYFEERRQPIPKVEITVDTGAAFWVKE